MAQCYCSTLAARDTAESNDVEAGARLPLHPGALSVVVAAPVFARFNTSV